MSTNTHNETHDVVQQANHWFKNSALPMWFDNGVDWSRGGFLESIDFQDLSCSANFKRLRVLTRQIFVFATACRLGESSARSVVSHGLEFLLGKHRLSSGGFASRVSLKGDIIEGPLDLYDLSFCLFALAHGYKLLGDQRLKDEAITLTQFISDRFRHVSVGYIESLPASLPRRQNPHMHLLEALIEWRKISDNYLFIVLSEEIVSLFSNKFYFSGTGALIEYFDDDLIPAQGQKGKITEPGHHFEWTWLLSRYFDISGKAVSNYSTLYQFAYNYGINPKTQLLWAEVTDEGVPTQSLVRIWPHTEWIKAEIALNAQINLRLPISKSWQALYRFLDCPRPGLWYEIYDHDQNKFLDTPAPASSLYHIVLAIDALNTQVQFCKYSNE